MNAGLTLVLTEVLATIPLMILSALAHLGTVEKSVLKKLTSVPVLPVCITVFVLTNLTTTSADVCPDILAKPAMFCPMELCSVITVISTTLALM